MSLFSTAMMNTLLSRHQQVTSHFSQLITQKSSLPTLLFTHISQFTTHTHTSLFNYHHSLQIFHQSPFNTHHTPQTSHHSPPTIGQSPHTSHHPPLSNHHTPLTIHHYVSQLLTNLTVLTLGLVSLRRLLCPQLFTLQRVVLECLPRLHLLPQRVLAEGVEAVPAAPVRGAGDEVLSSLRHGGRDRLSSPQCSTWLSS